MLLALDTSGPFCSAALHDGAGFIAVRSDDIGRGHAELLMPMLEEILADAGIGWKDLNHVACTTGPGSFTGLRVGLATARGLALGLGCSCTGVTVFEAFHFGETEPLAVTLDARRDQIWLQVFGSGESAPFAVGRDQAVATIPGNVSRLAGSAAPMLAAQNDGFSIISTAASPPIEQVALAAIRARSGNPHTTRPQPLYLRSPDAKPQQPALVGA